MDKNLDLTFEFKNFLLKVSAIRLGVMFFLLILALSEIFNFSDRGLRMELYRNQQYFLFFVAGFSVSLFHIFSINRFLRSDFILRIQFYGDIFFATWLIAMTGGSFSGFVFLYHLCLFLYGRIFGFRKIIFSSLFILIMLYIISCIQFYYPVYWGQEHIRGSDLAYNYSLLALTLVLVTSLVRMNSRTESQLLLQIIEKENSLRQAEELRYRVFDWIDAGLLLVNDDGRISSINQRALDWLPGQDRKSLINQQFNIFFPEFLSFWNDRQHKILHRNKVHSAEKNRTFGFKMTELPESQGWMILFSDITEVDRLEKQVKDMEKLATIGELAAGLAHEMKNPLAGIKTSLQLLLTEDLEKEFSDRLSKVILRDIDRLDFLLKDFLVFARPQTPAMEALNLGAEVRHALTPLRLQYPAVRMEMELGSEPYFFDRNQLQQILVNLLLNSFQALEGVENPRIVICEYLEGGKRTVAIEDNGPGLSEGVREKCFDPFVTTKAVGSGLGLSIARRLAAQNNAFLELNSPASGGTRALLVQEASLSVPRTEEKSA